MRTPWKRFLLCAGVAFALALATLLWLGPVWIHDAEDHLLAVLAAVFIQLFILALLVGAPVAESAGAAATVTGEAALHATATVAEAGAHGAHFLHRLARGAWPAAWGVTLGAIVALLTMWALAHSGPLRLVYARVRPARALAIDFVSVAAFLDEHKKAHGRPPADAQALGRAMQAAQVELRFSTVREETWRDAWDRPLVYEAKRSLFGWKVDAYSLGSDGSDNKGKPDDVSLRATMNRWKFLRAALEKYLEERK